MQEGLNALFRKARHYYYRVLDPFDALFLRVNKVSNYPPLSLRRHVSGLGFLDGPGCEFYAYLRLLADMTRDSRVLDIGCGCGLLELALEKNGWKGDLVGVDIHKPSINWCKRTLSRRVPSFQFFHSDIYNAAYWRGGQYTAEAWWKEFEERDFDCVIAKSLFTHMLPEESGLYIADISARLRQGGRGLLTFFIRNEEQEALQSSGKSSINFTKIDADDVFGVRHVAAPTSAVAYDEEYLMDLLKSNGLEPRGEIHYGTWSGRDTGLSYQDVVTVEKQ